MAGLFPMPMPELLTYQDVATRLKCCPRTAARILKDCQRFNPTRGTVRFLESTIERFLQANQVTRPNGRPDGKPDRRPDAKPDRVRRTKRPVSG